METIKLKRGDRSPSISAILNDANGPIPLAGCTVRFFARNRVTKELEIDGASATIVSEIGGAVRYDLTDDDVDTRGQYDIEWEITETSTGKKHTVPNDGFDRLVLGEDLG